MILPAPSPAHPLCSRLAVDLRSLALLRAGLALFLLIDSLSRLLHAGLLYTDDGLLPRDLAIGAIEAGRWSLHLANGGLFFAIVLSLLQVLAATALALGWRSRIAGPLLGLLLVSAIARHPAMFDASDALALALLAFGLMLPWNARWSVDAAFAPARPGPSHLSWPGIALLLFACLLPIGLALASDAPEGLLGLLSSPSAHLPGSALVKLPSLLPTLEIGLRIAAWLILPLALVPWARPYARRAALVFAVLLCAFALISVAPVALALLGLLAGALLIDGALWDRLAGDPALPDLRVHPNGDTPGALGMALLARELLCLQHTQVANAQDSPRASRLLANGASLIVIDRNEEAYLDGAAVAMLLRRSPLLRPLRGLLNGGFANSLGSLLLRLRGMAKSGRCAGHSPTDASGATSSRIAILASVLLLLLVVVQFGAAGVLPSALASGARIVLRPLALDRSWIDLLPAAGAAQRWIAVPGERSNGTEVDALSESLPPPNYGLSTLPWFSGERGRQYENALAQPGARIERLAFARFLCEQHSEALARVRVTLMVREAGAQIAEQRVLLRHECRAEESSP
ncbi:hypothetical protein DFR24_0202 [Panacagrimonas perspica]|uniref:HTTM-like domain-containing protein n=1 Tax=Panacagrimonas perspica TaxID=381431 RepID=A0A4R7P9Z9_9GAMM|nr:hypothetical protein [Panacagrimonas perspica]TDU30845.1 hypothetical protein DFR24_0202 [Panacagrimonas perspica]THD01656.1 hypothetical protein B1810_19315 [Panacagrimonas perspica]